MEFLRYVVEHIFLYQKLLRKFFLQLILFKVNMGPLERLSIALGESYLLSHKSSSGGVV